MREYTDQVAIVLPSMEEDLKREFVEREIEAAVAVDPRPDFAARCRARLLRFL